MKLSPIKENEMKLSPIKEEAAKNLNSTKYSSSKRDLQSSIRSAAKNCRIWKTAPKLGTIAHKKDPFFTELQKCHPNVVSISTEREKIWRW